MDKTIICPSPFWFQASGIAASSDGWLVYGATAKSLCVLVPSQPDDTGKISYNAQVVPKAHAEKIVSVNISPEWPNKRAFLTGSVDGVAKQWLVEIEDEKVKIKTTHSHEVHKGDREEVVSVGYSTEQYAVTLGADGKIVKWDFTSNIVQSFKNLIKNLRPLCMACSPHIPLHIAVGTKQGVIFLVDLNDNGKLLYKVRGHDEEIMNLGWCPKYEVEVKKHLKEAVSARMDKIRQEAANESDKTNNSITSETSGNDTDIVDEEDLFDKYKDHSSNEFGHKKYVPEMIAVQVKDESVNEGDFLAECEKLKSDILNKKNEPEPSIQSLVEAMEKTNVNGNSAVINKENGHSNGGEQPTSIGIEDSPKSVHIQRHLLASLGKNGTVHIWSKTAKQVSSCHLAYPSKQRSNKAGSSLTLLWYTPDTLLLSDSKCQIVATNPLEIDSKNKLSWRVIHSLHKRVPYCIVSGIARSQVGDAQPRPVWSVSQDRALIQYSLEDNKLLTNDTTTGGYVYDVVNCPYDADKLAVGAGDGAVRVLSGAAAYSYWNNVQGKVLKVAWHHTRENVLAFGTAEARVGIIEANGNTERPAKVLPSVLSNGVYGLCWVDDSLFACADGALVRYTPFANQGSTPVPVPVTLEGASWRVTEVQSSPHGLLVGSHAGGVAVLSSELPCPVIAAAFPATKAIQCIDWHPHQVSSSSHESPHNNWLAVCSLEKSITVLQLERTEAGEATLTVYKSWVAHKGQVCRVTWNPHVEAQLMSTSQDGLVKIWSAVEGVCTHILPGHGFGSLGSAWSSHPNLPHVALTGGTDYCLRLWDVRNHPADIFQECDLYANLKKADKKKKAKKEALQEKTVAEETTDDTDEQVATTLESKVKPPKKFLFPTIYKQMTDNSLTACRRLLQRHTRQEAANGNGAGDSNDDVDDESGYFFIKMFGSINDVNEVLDMEQREHESRDNPDAWLMVAMLRGHIQAMLDYAAQRSLLTPFILSLAPALSFKSWKDTSQLYISQIERLMAKGQEEALTHESRRYGGPVVGTAALQLAGTDVRGAVKTLTAARLWPAAYLVCRARHVDSLADDVLAAWAPATLTEGNLAVAALLYIVLGDLNMAATALGRSQNEECLSLAADIAKVAGLKTYANHIIQKTDLIKSGKEAASTEEALVELPSRLHLLLKENGSGGTNGAVHTNGTNGHKADE